MKNLPNIFNYFKHCSRELEAHDRGHLAVCIGEQFSDTQIQIQVSDFFRLLYRFISIPLDVPWGVFFENILIFQL